MKLADLVIQMSANTASLQKDFSHAGKMAEEFASSVKSALSGIGEALALGGIGEAIKGLVDWEHEMSDAAASTGMTIKEISGLSFALKSTGVPLQELQLGLSQFDKIVSGLMRSKAGAIAIQELGLSMQKLRTEGPHQALLDVADAFKKIPDGTQKAAIASALFTSTLGSKLIPVLDEGSSGILGLEAEARKLGYTLTDSDAKAADKTYMAFQQLNAQMRGLEVSAGSRLFPALIEISEALVGDTHALTAFADGLEITGLAMAKLVLYSNPLTWVGVMKGPMALIKREMDQLETDRQIQLDDMSKGLQALTIPGIGGGKLDLNLPISNAAAGKVKEVAKALKSIREELTGLSQGDVAQGLERLRDLGATPTQLAQGRALLEQIAGVKAAKKAQDEWSSATREYGSILATLHSNLSDMAQPLKTYTASIEQLNQVAFKGIDITKGLDLAHQQFMKTMMAHSTPQQMGLQMPSTVPGSGIGGPTNIPGLSMMQKMKPMMDTISSSLGSSFDQLISKGESFDAVIKSLVDDFAEFLLKSVLFSQISNMFAGQSGFGGMISSFFGGLAGGRAAGGPVTSGQLYMVGEQGPELFAPGMSGSIIPNVGATAKSSGPNVNIDARGADAGVEARIMRAMQAMHKSSAVNALVANYEYQARGGSL